MSLVKANERTPDVIIWHGREDGTAELIGAFKTPDTWHGSEMGTQKLRINELACPDCGGAEFHCGYAAHLLRSRRRVRMLQGMRILIA